MWFHVSIQILQNVWFEFICVLDEVGNDNVLVVLRFQGKQCKQEDAHWVKPCSIGKQSCFLVLTTFCNVSTLMVPFIYFL